MAMIAITASAFRTLVIDHRSRTAKEEVAKTAKEIEMVGTTGFEPATSRTPSVRATRLRHVPSNLFQYGRKLRFVNVTIRVAETTSASRAALPVRRRPLRANPGSRAAAKQYPSVNRAGSRSVLAPAAVWN